MLVKNDYIQLCEKVNVCVYQQAWYLNALLNDEWHLASVYKNDVLVAALPFWTRKSKGVSFIVNPPLVKFLQPVIDYPEGQKLARRYTFQKEILEELIAQLPKVDRIDLQLGYTDMNLLPFVWEGSQIHQRYSYRIHDTSDLNAVFANFSENIRRAIRKAEKSLRVEISTDYEGFMYLNEQSFDRQGLKLPYPKDYCNQLFNEGKENILLLLAKDEEGNIHAGAFFIKDADSAFYQLGGANTDLRSSGAVSLLLWEGIKWASTNGLKFDFEGSMLPEIERFFRAFGGSLDAYPVVVKSASLKGKVHAILK